MKKGTKHSKEVIEKMRVAHLGQNKGGKLSLEHRQKLSKAHLGKPSPLKGKKTKPHSAEWRKMMSERFRGEKNPFYGRKHTKEAIEKIVKTHKGKPSKKWKGGYENTLFLNRQRRVRKIGNGGLHTLGEWSMLKAQYNWTCPCCRKSEPSITLSLDHIVPLSKGGSDNIENIQPLCRSCNSKKHNKTIKYHA